MKSLKQIQTLTKLGKVFSRIAYIGAMVGFFVFMVGLISLAFGLDESIKIGGVTLHGIVERGNHEIEFLYAAFPAWMIVCAGAAVVAKFAEIYFKNEQMAGTPFTQAGAKELKRLGIVTISVTLGCRIVADIVQAVIAGFVNVDADAATDIFFQNDGTIAFGIMFLILALFCQYGVEKTEDLT